MLRPIAAPRRVPRRHRVRQRVRVRCEGQEEPRLPGAPRGRRVPGGPAARGRPRPQHVRRDFARSRQKAHFASDVFWFRWFFSFSPFPPSLNVAPAQAEPRFALTQPGSSGAARGSRRGADPAAPRLPNLAADAYLSRQRRPRTLPAASRSCRSGGTGRAGAGRRRQLPLRRSGCLPSASLFISISQPLAVPALFTAAPPLAPPSRGRSLQPGRISRTGALMPRCPHGKVSPSSGGSGLLAGLPAALCRLTEPLAGLDSPVQRMQLGACRLCKGRGLRHPSPQLLKSQTGAWHAVVLLGRQLTPLAPSRGGVSPCTVL